MYLRKVPARKGRTHLSIAKNIHVPGKGSRAKNIETLGYLDTLQQKYPDPIAHFEAVIDQMNREEEEANRAETLSYSCGDKLEAGAAERNIGYAALSVIYHELGIGVFFNNHARKYKAQFNLNSVMRLLVYLRVLKPGSKKAAHENRAWLFDKADFTLDDVYRALTYASNMADDLQVWMHKRILAKHGRDTTVVYYDVTNYYFEIDEEDELLKRGASKEHRPNPIVQMGLFMDNDGVPMAYRLFPGNNNDCTTFVPFISGIRREYGVGKMVAVADKGMNTAKNVYYLANGRGWYVFSQSVRGGTKELKAYVLKKAGYAPHGEGCKIKSRQHTRHVKIEQKPGPDIEADISEKQVVLYSRDYDRKAKMEREKVLKKTEDIIRDPSKYNKYNTHGAAKYVEHIEYDNDTGEIIEAKSIIKFNHAKLAEDEKYDGYYVIATNAFDKDDEWVLNKYKGLWKIEETFKITKSDLEARPVFVKREDHIEAHFLTCFIALTLIRLLEKRLGGKYSASQLVDSLSRACCANISENKYMSFYFDDTLKDIGNALGIDFSLKFRTLQDIKKLIGETKK
jgi:transposase